MKKVVFFAVLIGVLPWVSSAWADALKIGFVDAQKVFESSDEGKRVQANVQEYVESRQKIIDIEEKELRQMEEDLRKQAALLSPEATKMKQNEMQKKFAEYQQKARAMNQEVQDKKVETNRAFFKILETAIQETAKKEGYNLVLDKNREGGTVLYSEDTSDITDKVITHLNTMTKK
ncbi:MAG: OmpH family outer membrane protein [Nitrospiria bacterium]